MNGNVGSDQNSSLILAIQFLGYRFAVKSSYLSRYFFHCTFYMEKLYVAIFKIQCVWKGDTSIGTEVLVSSVYTFMTTANHF